MKHLFKRTVVLLNDFKTINTLLKKAIDFSTKHHTTLEILYVQEEALFKIPDYFLSDDKIANESLDKERVKAKIQEHLVTLGVEDKHAIFVYEDDTLDQLLHYGQEQKDIVCITTYQQGLSEKLIEKTPYSFWIVKNDIQSYNSIILPLDFSENSKKALETTKHIFSKSTLTMVHDYRYLLDTMQVQVDYLNIVPVITADIFEVNEQLKEEQKKKFETYQKEFNIKGECIEGEGALDQDLIEYLSKRACDLTIMYHQNEELFLSPTLILELLKGVSSDFFIFNF